MSAAGPAPVAGLPGPLPPGERILWQGAPDRRVLARTAFHIRGIAAYFAALALIAHAVAAPGEGHAGVGMTMALGAAAIGLLYLLAWGAARTTVYTLTDRRIVMRVGIAVPKSINLPLRLIASVDLAQRGDGAGDVALTLLGAPAIGYPALWPHARPFRFMRPQPMLRAVPDSATVAATIARACLAANPGSRVVAAPSIEPPLPTFAEAQAA